jgi:TRAP transporter TAXI family solute receptor
MLYSHRGFCFLLIAAIISFSFYPDPSKADPVGLVTGPKTGTYIAMGRDIAELAKSQKIDVEVKDSSGSIDNIKRITSGEKASIGIVQSDVLGFLSRSQNPESIKIAQKMRMIFPLHNEEIHVLARKEIASFSDLNGKRVIVGTEGSGNMLTSVNLFSLMGIVPDKMFKVEPTKGIVAVLNNEADAIIFVGGKPVRMFKNMEELTGLKDGPDAGKLDQVHFLPLNDPRLLKEYAASTITGYDYNYVKEPVPTIAVTAILMAYDFSPQDNKYRKNQCENITQLSRLIRSNMDQLQSKGHPKWKEVNLNTSVGFWEKDKCAWSEAALKPLNSEHSLEKDLISIVRNRASNAEQKSVLPSAPVVAQPVPPTAPIPPMAPAR